MKLAIMQPYFFPYISYFQLISAVDKFVLLDDVAFIKKGWINRNRILNFDTEYFFTLPLEKISQNKLIKDIRIHDLESFKSKFLKTLEHFYKKAGFFNETYNLVRKILDYNTDNISEMNFFCTKEICNYLGIDAEIIRTSTIYNNSNLKAEYKIMDICKKENADFYINAYGGKKLYKNSFFAENNINLKFLETFIIKYKQFNNEYIPYMSIIDMMMFNNKEQISEYLKMYKLID